MAKWTAADIPDQTGTTVVVTGANSGLGLRSAEALAAKGALVLHGLPQRGEGGRRSGVGARPKATGAAPEVVALDLSSLASVRECAAGLAERFDHLDVLHEQRRDHGRAEGA